jgi:hypothetical protein
MKVASAIEVNETPDSILSLRSLITSLLHVRYSASE